MTNSAIYAEIKALTTSCWTSTIPSVSASTTNDASNSNGLWPYPMALTTSACTVMKTYNQPYDIGAFKVDHACTASNEPSFSVSQWLTATVTGSSFAGTEADDSGCTALSKTLAAPGTLAAAGTSGGSLAAVDTGCTAANYALKGSASCSAAKVFSAKVVPATASGAASFSGKGVMLAAALAVAATYN